MDCKKEMSKDLNTITEPKRDSHTSRATGVAYSFDCFLCGGNFNRIGEPCKHYDDDEMDKEGEASLCDGCAKKVMNKAKQENTQGLSIKFFNCE